MVQCEKEFAQLHNRIRTLALEEKVGTIGGHMRKTGQETDFVKEKILLPFLVGKIKRETSAGQIINFHDFGSGDGSFVSLLLTELLKQKRFVHELGLAEVDKKAFHTLVERTTQNKGKFPAKSANVIHLNDASLLERYVDDLRNFHDFALAQLVFHHIHDDPTLSYLMYSICRTLKHGGLFFAINFDDEFIQYLLDNEEEKLSVLHRNQEDIEAFYHFDSKGKNYIKHRTAQNIVYWALTAGLKLKSSEKIFPCKIRNKKSRYKYLCENDIPMFRALTFERDDESFISSNRISVKSIDLKKQNIVIHAEDGSSVMVKQLKHAKDIRKGDLFLTQEMLHKNQQFITYWIVRNEKVVFSGILNEVL